MKAIEFISDAEDGFIKIPKKYSAQLKKKFRVIILLEDEILHESPKQKKQLKAMKVKTKDIKFDRDEANKR